MMRLRRFAIAVLASVTIVVGSLATPSTASAMDCRSAAVVGDFYHFTAWALWLMGSSESRYWSGKAAGIMVGCG